MDSRYKYDIKNVDKIGQDFIKVIDMLSLKDEPIDIKVLEEIKERLSNPKLYLAEEVILGLHLMTSYIINTTSPTNYNVAQCNQLIHNLMLAFLANNYSALKELSKDKDSAFSTQIPKK